ncbi:hypothetical protein FOPE_00865 [Fonsecaea pedrosoi]|nr:hypothetical protein FOPE_00865 [Fonsecaea pedrosoi]
MMGFKSFLDKLPDSRHAVVFLASLATLAATTPASAQWQKADASAAGVAQHGKPSGTAAGGDRGAHENGDWQQSAKQQDEKSERKSSFQKDDGTGKANRHQARGEAGQAPHRAFANHKGVDGPQHKPEEAKENDNNFKQHHARTADVLGTLRRMDQKEDDHAKRPQDGDRDSSSQRGDGDHGRGNEEHGSYNAMDDRERGKGKQHDARATTQRGVYECSGQNWQQPCVWTPLKEGQCYNRSVSDN